MQTLLLVLLFLFGKSVETSGASEAQMGLLFLFLFLTVHVPSASLLPFDLSEAGMR